MFKYLYSIIHMIYITIKCCCCFLIPSILCRRKTQEELGKGEDTNTDARSRLIRQKSFKLPILSLDMDHWRVNFF